MTAMKIVKARTEQILTQATDNKWSNIVGLKNQVRLIRTFCRQKFVKIGKTWVDRKLLCGYSTLDKIPEVSLMQNDNGPILFSRFYILTRFPINIIFNSQS